MHDMSFIAELKRRNVAKMAALYVVAAWLILQAAEVLTSLLPVPEWTGPFIVILLVLGFFPAVIFSWVFEMTPEGLKREKDIEHGVSITDETGRKMNYLIVGLLVLVVVVVALDRLIPETAAPPTEAPATADTATPVPQTPVDEGPVVEIPDKSIAVLPFADMSPEQDQGYFADGLSEELLNLLAKIPELHVAARTSSFSFRGDLIDIPTIADQLKVATVLEGSVRKAGNKIRITAQLIKADDGYHLWSETYDRTLDDIFAVQDEISTAVVDYLKVVLLGEKPESTRIDPDAYEIYLKAIFASRQGEPEDWEKAIGLFEQALAIEPTYAPAWNELSGIYINQINSGLRPLAEGIQDAKLANRRALAADPQSAVAYSALGWLEMNYESDFAEAAKHFRRAVELAPNDSAILSRSGILAAVLGRRNMATGQLEHALELDPVRPPSYSNLSDAYLKAGRFEDAEATATQGLVVSPGYPFTQANFGMSLVLQDRGDEAVVLCEDIGVELVRLIVCSLAYHSAGATDKAEQTLATLKEKFGGSAAFYVAMNYAWRGDNDAAFEWLERAVEGSQEVMGVRTDPFMKDLHGDPRWEPFLTRVGLSNAQVAQIIL